MTRQKIDWDKVGGFVRSVESDVHADSVRSSIGFELQARQRAIKAVSLARSEVACMYVTTSFMQSASIP